MRVKFKVLSAFLAIFTLFSTSAGAFPGKDALEKDYQKAEITHEHNIFSKDRYTCLGKKISQKTAEALTTMFLGNFDIKGDDSKREEFKRIYTNVAITLTNLTKQLEAERDSLNSKIFSSNLKETSLIIEVNLLKNKILELTNGNAIFKNENEALKYANAALKNREDRIVRLANDLAILKNENEALQCANAALKNENYNLKARY